MTQEFYIWDVVKYDCKRWLVVNASYFKSSGKQTFVDIMDKEGNTEHIHVNELMKLGKLNLDTLTIYDGRGDMEGSGMGFSSFGE